MYALEEHFASRSPTSILFNFAWNKAVEGKGEKLRSLQLGSCWGRVSVHTTGVSKIDQNGGPSGSNCRLQQVSRNLPSFFSFVLVEFCMSWPVYKCHPIFLHNVKEFSKCYVECLVATLLSTT